MLKLIPGSLSETGGGLMQLAVARDEGIVDSSGLAFWTVGARAGDACFSKKLSCYDDHTHVVAEAGDER